MVHIYVVDGGQLESVFGPQTALGPAFSYPRSTSNRGVDGLPEFCNSLLTSDSRSELLFRN
jgi:hypothetical protein